jgi:hypothetical protein
MCLSTEWKAIYKESNLVGGDADPRAVEDSRHLKLTMRKSSGS